MSRKSKAIERYHAPHVKIARAVRAGDYVHTCAIGDHFFRLEDLLYDQTGNVISDGSEIGPRPFSVEVRGTVKFLEESLELAGCGLSDVVDLQCWLKDPRDFHEFNQIYEEYFDENPPVRSVFQTGFMFYSRVELKALAYKPVK